MTADDKPSRRRHLNEEEATLWRGVTRSVEPLRRKRVQPEPTGVPIKAAKAPAPPRPGAIPAVRAAAPKPPPALIPLDRRTRQRLARGTDAVDARIDLHGRTQSQAHVALLRFLQRAQSGGARFVLVITGKGGRSGDFAAERGVLRRQVPLWLGLPEFRALVAGFDDAHIGHGGEGALYVRLRRGR